MMRPPSPRSTMGRAAAWVTKKVPLRFVSRTASQLASSTSNTPCGMFKPALLTRMSRCPNLESTLSTPARTEATSATSMTTGIEPNRFAICAADSCSRLVPATVAPASLSAAAIPAPRPRLAPVTKATFPSSRKDRLIGLHRRGRSPQSWLLPIPSRLHGRQPLEQLVQRRVAAVALQEQPLSLFVGVHQEPRPALRARASPLHEPTQSIGGLEPLAQPPLEGFE